MVSNYDDDNEQEFGSMPSFIPKDAPAVTPPKAKDGDELHAASDESRNDTAITEPGGAKTPSEAPDAALTEKAAEDPVTREVLADGTQVETWFDAGEIHRVGAPAVVKVFADGTREEQWYLEGKLHRDGGPAITRADGSQEHWLKGERRLELEMVESSVPATPSVAPTAKAIESKPDPEVDPEVLEALMMAMQKGGMLAPSGSQSTQPEPGSKPQPPAPSAGVIPTAAPGASAEASSRAGAEAAQSGLRSLADGGLGLVGGLASLAGSMGRGVGGAARGLASDIEAKRQARADGGLPQSAPRIAPGMSVLPRISEYRVEQAEKMANAYESSMEKFWASGKLPDVRRAIEEHARETGASVPDVMAKMVPGGELEDLRTRFIDAVGESPDAQASKKGMDRALDSWIRQYGRGSEELLNPETGQNSDYDKMRERFEGTRGKMEDLVTQSPVFAGESKSHAMKFREAVERIAQKIRETLERVADFLRGRNSAAEQQRDSGYEP